MYDDSATHTRLVLHLTAHIVSDRSVSYRRTNCWIEAINNNGHHQ
jgi:hypothetical protein